MNEWTPYSDTLSIDRWKPRRLGNAIVPEFKTVAIGMTPLLTLLETAFGNLHAQDEDTYSNSAPSHTRAESLLLRTMHNVLVKSPRGSPYEQTEIRAQSIVLGFALRTMDIPTNADLALCVALELVQRQYVAKLMQQLQSKGTTSPEEVIYSVIARATRFHPCPYWFGVAPSDPPSATVPAFSSSRRQLQDESCLEADVLPPMLPSLSLNPFPVGAASAISTAFAGWRFESSLSIFCEDDPRGGVRLCLSGPALSETDTQQFLQEHSSPFSGRGAKDKRLLLVGEWKPLSNQARAQALGLPHSTVTELQSSSSAQPALMSWTQTRIGDHCFKPVRTLLIAKEGKNETERWKQIAWFSHPLNCAVGLANAERGFQKNEVFPIASPFHSNASVRRLEREASAKQLHEKLAFTGADWRMLEDLQLQHEVPKCIGTEAREEPEDSEESEIEADGASGFESRRGTVAFNMDLFNL